MKLFSTKKTATKDTHIIPEETQEVSTTTTPVVKENALLDIVRFSVIALIIVIPIRSFIAQPFIVSGASMENTFHTGEYLIVDQLSYELHAPARGDVIVFRYPRDPSKFFIKRVIGLPGETISIEGSVVKITNKDNPSGMVLDEPYIKSMVNGSNISEMLGDREYFVMGDNRDQSSDSRFWGVLTSDRIIGRAYLRLFPPSKLGYLPGAIEAN